MIREAEAKDIPRLTELCRMFFEESGLAATESFCPESMSAFHARLLSNPAAITAVAESDGEVQGLLCALMAPEFHNSAIFKGHEIYWYVVPEQRGTSMGVRLMRHVEQWMKEHGAKEFWVSHMAAFNADSASSLYRRMGFSPVNHVYSKVL